MPDPRGRGRRRIGRLTCRLSWWRGGQRSDGRGGRGVGPAGSGRRRGRRSRTIRHRGSYRRGLQAGLREDRVLYRYRSRRGRRWPNRGSADGSRSRCWFWKSSSMLSSCSVTRWGLLEGLAALAMEQGHQGGLAHIFHVDDSATLVGSDRAGGLVHDDVAAQPIDLVLGADVGDELQDLVGTTTSARSRWLRNRRSRSACSASAQLFMNSKGLASKDIRAHHLAALGRQESPSTSTASPKRSRSWGRRSPSRGS